MRIFFCGSGSFAVPVLRAIVASGHEIVGAVTQPARPAGRGGKLRATPIAGEAEELAVDIAECPDINADNVVADVRRAAPDVIVVADFGQMVRAPVREAAAIDAINLHGSLLPELRGAAPINWAIIRGHKTTGVTTFSLVDRMDAGDIYLQAEIAIAPDQTAEELREILAELGAKLVIDTLDAIAGGRVTTRPQDDAQATRAPLLTKTDGVIDWSADATTICNLIRGTRPWPGGQAVYLRAGGKPAPVILSRASALPEGGGGCGVIDEDLCVSAGQGRVRIAQIKPAGKRLMSWRDFVNGYRTKSGDRFERGPQ